MYALIQNGMVRQIADKTFPVSDSFKWVETKEDISPGDRLVDGSFVKAVNATPKSKKEPLSVTVAKYLLDEITKEELQTAYKGGKYAAE